MSQNNPSGPGAMPGGEQADLIRQRALLAHALSDAHNGERDYYKTFGWNRNPDVEDYYVSYFSNPYAKRVVNAPANVAWRDPPEIVDRHEGDAGEQTQFEADVKDLVESTRAWHYLKRADRLQGIGQFGVCLIGWADNADGLIEPVDRTAVANNDPADAIRWMRPFSQLSVESIRYGDRSGDRWGDPVYYKLDLADENDAGTKSVFGGADREQWVHHDRVLLLNEGLLDDEVRGTPRQQSAFNVLTDIEKTMGAAPETAYAHARPGLHANIDKDYQLTDDGSAIAEELAGYVHDQEPLIKTHGVDINRIAGETVDPSKIMEMLVGALSTDTEIPVSVLRGKEVADRAKSEDLQQWYGTIGERREGFLTPRVIRGDGLIQRALDFGVLTPPVGGGFDVEWPPLAEESEQDKADVQLARSKVAKNMQSLMPGYGTEEWREVVTDGTFPDPPDNDMRIDPADLDDLESRIEEQEQQAQQSPGEQAIADGGTDE